MAETGFEPMWFMPGFRCGRTANAYGTVDEPSERDDEPTRSRAIRLREVEPICMHEVCGNSVGEE